MKTLEVHEMFIKNPKARFHRSGIEYFLQNGIIKAKQMSDMDTNAINSYEIWADHDDWELIPQEVTWKEAIQAWVDGKSVVCKLSAQDSGMDLPMAYRLGRYALSKKEITNGKWYIE